MDCREFQLAAVSDDPGERAAAERHATGCATCAEILREDLRLFDEVARWKAAAPAPQAYLEHRIAATLAQSQAHRTAPPASSDTRRRAWLSWPRMAAAAALVALGAMALWNLRSLPAAVSTADLEQIAQNVERLRDEYVHAIAQLEVQAGVVLAAADDTAVPAERADILNAYRDRLTHLDTVIADVEGFLDEHAGHAGGHTVLLAALQEKSELLQEVLDLRPGETS